MRMLHKILLQKLFVNLHSEKTKYCISICEKHSKSEVISKKSLHVPCVSIQTCYSEKCLPRYIYSTYLRFINFDRKSKQILGRSCKINFFISCHLEIALVHYLHERSNEKMRKYSLQVYVEGNKYKTRRYNSVTTKS